MEVREHHRKHAARGAALLDEKVPDWATRLDLDSLDIRVCDRCVVGQLFGRTETDEAFSAGLKRLGFMTGGMWNWEEYGFCSDTPTAAWRPEIEKRLNPKGMEIGEEEREYTIEPAKNPIPQKVPQERPAERPKVPTPAPDEAPEKIPEKVPSK